MYMDGRTKQYHCLLVTGEGHRDGVLVEAEGYSYARYAAYVPEISALSYRSLAKANAALTNIVEKIIEEGTSMTRTGNWSVDYYEVLHQMKIDSADEVYLQKLMQSMLEERHEVLWAECIDGGFDIQYRLEFCPNSIKEVVFFTEKGQSQPDREQHLWELLCTRWENVDLVHSETGNQPRTIAELDVHTLTDEGKEAWSDVLEAKVERVYEGYFGLQIELSGVKAERLNAFSAMLGGYCSDQDYKEWVNDSADEPVNQQLNNL